MSLEVQKINIALIDEPQNPMRTDAYDEDIKELAESIKLYGLLQPITLKKNGDRYEVVAGHRRLLAHKYLGLSFIDAIVRDLDDKVSDILKVEENLRRKDVNPVDEAIFIAGFMDRNNLSVKDASALLNRSEQFVQSRLDLLHYPDYLLSYIRDGKISLGAAQYLALIQPEYLRRDYCRIASIRGLSINMAKDWLNQSRFNQLPANPDDYRPSESLTSFTPQVSKYECLFCHKLDEVVNLYNGWYHLECKRVYDEVFNEKSGGVEPDQNFEQND